MLDRMGRYRDAGLLILRVGVGLSFLAHGWPKLAGGPERWAALGEKVGFEVAPAFFGLFAGLGEFGGGTLLILGLFFRPAALALCLIMAAAFYSHVSAGDGFSRFSHALELAFVFFGLACIGPGRYSLDARRTATPSPAAPVTEPEPEPEFEEA